MKKMYQTTCSFLSGDPSLKIKEVSVLTETKHFIYLYDDAGRRHRRCGAVNSYHETLREAINFIYKTAAAKVEESAGQIKRLARQLSHRRKICNHALSLLISINKKLKEEKDG